MAFEIKNPLILILGPTCTGKTSLAEKLCSKYTGEIISADSRQIYRYMDVGTGKVPLLKKSGSVSCKTHLQDVVTPNQHYSVSDWSKAAQNIANYLWATGKTPFVVGGTGFYIDVLLGNRQLSGVEPDYKLREELEKLSLGELFERLENEDSERAENIDRKNKRRLVRALEVVNSKSVSNTNLNSVSMKKSTILILGLTASNEFLYQRADSWVESILEDNALLDETADLISRGYKNNEPLQGIIYKTVVEYLENSLSYGDMKQRIKWDIHAYIRRQLTWFKKSPKGINWFDISKPDHFEKVENSVKYYLGITNNKVQSSKK